MQPSTRSTRPARCSSVLERVRRAGQRRRVQRAEVAAQPGSSASNVANSARGGGARGRSADRAVGRGVTAAGGAAARAKAAARAARSSCDELVVWSLSSSWSCALALENEVLRADIVVVGTRSIGPEISPTMLTVYVSTDPAKKPSAAPRAPISSFQRAKSPPSSSSPRGSVQRCMSDIVPSSPMFGLPALDGGAQLGGARAAGDRRRSSARRPRSSRAAGRPKGTILCGNFDTLYRRELRTPPNHCWVLAPTSRA